MFRFLPLLILGFICQFATAIDANASARQARFLEIGKRKVYVEYEQAEPRHPTLVLLNGLTYSLRNWDSFAKELEKRAPKAGLLRIDLLGMGKTLLEGPLPVISPISYQEQVEVVASAMKILGITKAFIGGLSYGGGLAVAFAHAHPELVNQVILMAPFTEPLEPMDQFIKGQISANRIAFPMNPASDDELYDFFLHQFIYATYPGLEPSVLENPFKLEAIFRMVQGIRKYDTLKDARSMPALSTHLILADQDQYIQKEVHNRFWKAVSPGARASRIDISYSEHKVPEAIPAFSASWVEKILYRSPELNRGLFFQGNTREQIAKSGQLEIPVK